MSYKLFGIPNCDTVKKARTALEKKKIDYEFVDFKKTPPTASEIEGWAKIFGELPVNKKGPTFRKLKEQFESLDKKKQIQLMIEQPSMIKRPILEKSEKIICFGYDEDTYIKLK